MWINSTKALQRIQGSAKGQQILESTQASQWKHCPGPLNPADDGTRGIPLSEFSNKSRMFTRPNFRCEPECNWPKLQLNDANTDTLQFNDRTGHMDEIATTPVIAFQASTEKTVQSFIDYSRFSKWTRILRTTAYVFDICQQTSTSVTISRRRRTLASTWTPREISIGLLHKTLDYP